jgi:hypothetical protein
MLNSTVDTYPRARNILAHAGGFVPYASHRFAELARVFRSDARKLAYCLSQTWLSFSNSARTGTCHTWNYPIATGFNST